MISPNPNSHAADINFDLPPLLADIQTSCIKMAEVDPKETQKVAALLMGMSLKYYAVVQKQAEQSFRWALLAAAIGAGFFGYSCWLAMNARVAGAMLSLIAGTLVQVISGINFYLYSKTARQFAGFHICLERINRYLLANSYCENLTTDNARDACRQRMIEVMATAPMLTLEQVGISVSPSASHHEHAASASAGR